MEIRLAVVPCATADELFAGGRIRAFYPVFGRVLEDEAATAPAAPRAPLGRLFQLEHRSVGVDPNKAITHLS